MHAWRLLSFCLALATVSCASASAPIATVASPSTPGPPPDITWEEKLVWMVRLEDQRILKDPDPPAPVLLQPATATTTALYALPAPSNLIPLLSDPEGRVRRRAALAVGRVGLADGVEPLIPLLSDADVEVRQMAAFALGLIGNASARGALIKALDDPEPVVQGRAAEALGAIGNRADADAVSGVVRRQTAANALKGLDADDVSYPLSGPAEAARLAIYALVRLGSYDALAAAVLDGSGQPVSQWWPVAYALGRINDPRAAPALLNLLRTPGRYTAAFAARGLAAVKAPQAAAALRQIVEDRQRTHPAVVFQAVRGLAAVGDASVIPALVKVVADRAADANLRLEAATTIGAVANANTAELLIELLADPVPGIRAVALKALARVDPDLFVVTLAGLEPDQNWSVRVSEAAALGTLPAERSQPRLMMLLDDRDQRVVPAAVEALAASKPRDLEKILIEKLQADDFAVRAAAATALGGLKSPAAVPALVEAYKIATGDLTYGAREAILTAINTIEPATGRQLLQQALTDKDWALRLRAATLLRPGGADVDVAVRPAPSDLALGDKRVLALLTPQYSPHAFIDTDKGTIEVELAVLDAPLTVENFMTLARKGYFNGLTIHRVVPDFVVQDGDPRGDGEGGPGYTIRDELNERPYLRGTVGMALAGKDTGGSQFFITHSPQPHLDARYTAFGSVVNGMDVVDRLTVGDIVRDVRIWDGVTEK